MWQTTVKKGKEKRVLSEVSLEDLAYKYDVAVAAGYTGNAKYKWVISSDDVRKPTTYVYKAVVHYGQECMPKCGTIQALSANDAESMVIDILLEEGSTELSDFMIREAKDVSKKCALVKNKCESCCLR
jgi:hypothetical protein